MKVTREQIEVIAEEVVSWLWSTPEAPTDRGRREQALGAARLAAEYTLVIREANLTRALDIARARCIGRDVTAVELTLPLEATREKLRELSRKAPEDKAGSAADAG